MCSSSSSSITAIPCCVHQTAVTYRQADLSKLPYQDTGHPISQPSVLTHVDFTESSGPNILERYFAEEAAAELKKKPWAIIQVRSAARQSLQRKTTGISCQLAAVEQATGTMYPLLDWLDVNILQLES